MNISMKIVSKRLIIDILFMTINFKAWRGEGLPLSTTSNEAAKMYDATLTQVSLYTCMGGESYCERKVSCARTPYSQKTQSLIQSPVHLHVTTRLPCLPYIPVMHMCMIQFLAFV